MTPLGYALMAEEAYKADPDIGSAFSSSRAICRQVDDGFCVTFRGSDNNASWVTDADIIVENDTKLGKVHKGFWQAWTAIAGQVKAEIAGNRGIPVTFCGHSLGAALAILAALDCAQSGISVKAVYAFEPPCISPQSNIKNLLAESKIAAHLYKNGGDLVCDLPMFWSQSGLLTHIGKPALPNIEDHLIENVCKSLTVLDPVHA